MIDHCLCQTLCWKELHLPEFLAARRNQAGNGCQVRFNKNRSLVKTPKIKIKIKMEENVYFKSRFAIKHSKSLLKQSKKCSMQVLMSLKYGRNSSSCFILRENYNRRSEQIFFLCHLTLRQSTKWWKWHAWVLVVWDADEPTSYSLEYNWRELILQKIVSLYANRKCFESKVKTAITTL